MAIYYKHALPSDTLESLLAKRSALANANALLMKDAATLRDRLRHLERSIVENEALLERYRLAYREIKTEEDNPRASLP